MDAKRIQITFAAVTAAAFLGIAVGFAAKKEAQPPATVMESVSGISAASPQIQKPKYLLSHYEGKLAVYIIGKKDPELVFDRFLHYLPDVDRMRIEKGIEVSDYSELLRLIEDYTS